MKKAIFRNLAWSRRIKSEFASIIIVLIQDRKTIVTGAIFLSLTLALLILFLIASQFKESSHFANVIFIEFHPSIDNSITENFNHGLAFLTAALFLNVYLQTQSRAALSLSVLYSFIWFDDSALFHERVGAILARAFDIQPFWGLRAQDFGELLAWSSAGAVLLAIFIWAAKASKAGDLGVFLASLICFGMLLISGIFFDMLHIILGGTIFDLLEDGGEMLSLVAAATLAVGLSRNADSYYAACK